MLDKGFGRKVNGVWVGGPVDAYKCWCSATLFAAVAHKQNDAEVRNIAVEVLRHFDGDIKYRSAGLALPASWTAGLSSLPTC